VAGSQDIRCFLSLEIVPEIRTYLGQMTDRLRTAGADVKWVDPKNIHLTLMFIGTVTAAQASALTSALGALRGRHPGLAAALSGWGGVPGPAAAAHHLGWVGLPPGGR